MRTNLCVWAVYLTFSLFTQAQTQQTWVKSPQNPIIPAQNGFSAEPAVIFDNTSQKYKMWYSAFHNGVYHIFYATSANGTTWTNHSSNPVLSPGVAGTWDSYSVRSSTVLFKDGEYCFYYFATGVLSGIRIGLAKSQDGIHWEKFQGNPILSPGAPGSWDANTVYHPKVVHDGAKFYMWYAGSDGNYVRGGWATSADGKSWTKHPTNPVLLAGPSGSWDEYRVWPSSGVVVKDNKFVMLYTGVTFANPSSGPIGLAISDDGINWQKDNANPVLLAGDQGSWDQNGLGNASLLFEGERFKVWYAGHDANDIWRIGYAESQPGFPPSDSTDYALSFDGSDDLVLIPDQNNSLDLSDFTIECRVQIKSPGKIHELVTKDAEGEDHSVNSNYSFDVWSDQKFRIIFENENQDNHELFSNTTLKVGEAYHMAATFDSHSNALSLYLNGQLDAGPTVVVGRPNHQNQPLRIGTGYEGGPRTTTHGIIDEVRIWKVARSQNDIQATMNKLLLGNENDLVGYWRFDEGEGQIVHDLTAFQNHGKRGLSDASEMFDPTWVLSPWQIAVDSSDYALQFDGTDDLVQIDEINGALDLNDFTLEAWVLRMDENKTEEIIHKGNMGENPNVNTNYAILFREDNFARAHFEYPDSRNIEVVGTTRIRTGQWYHIAGVRSSAENTLKVYVNGVLDAPPLHTDGLPNQQNSPVRIGANDPGLGIDENLKGLIDEVRIWNRARAQAEIEADMDAALLGNEPGLVGYWRLNEGEGQIVHDLSPFATPGHRGASENPDTADPAWVLANRTPATGCLGIPLPAGEAYGNINQNRQTHSDKITYCFNGPPGDRFLSFAVYDIDRSDEVSLSLNGETLLYVPVTANNTWSSLVGVLLSDAQIHDHQDNALVFDNTRNPPQNWRWGARQVSVDPFYALPSPTPFGNITGGDTQHADKVVYIFSGRGGDLNLAYQVFDIDHLDEVDVVVNDTKLHDEALTSNEAWSETRNLLLPDELVHNTGINVLIFENTKNPPRNWRWGVRNVSVNVATTSSLALPSQTGASFSGLHAQNAHYLLDGQLAPLVRPQGDGSANDTSRYVIQGATTIAPNGHVIIELPAPQKIDYLSLYPEWHAQRYYSFRVETSEDGRNWSTAIDQMNTKLQGTQIERIAKTGVRYLRLTGFSVVLDPDSSLSNGLSEATYWQNYSDLLQQAQPEALAIAELVLLKQDGNVKVDEPVAEVPTQYRLEQNLPNPFNPSTIIRFDLPQAGRVHLAVYNLRGELVRTLVDGALAPGAHAFTFEASGMATGVYFYRMSTEKFSATKKMLLAK